MGTASAMPLLMWLVRSTCKRSGAFRRQSQIRLAYASLPLVYKMPLLADSQCNAHLMRSEVDVIGMEDHVIVCVADALVE